MSVLLTITNPYTNDSAVVDTYPDESISLSWKFTDIKDLTVRGAFTREFRVPGTETNIGLFGPLFDVNYDGSFSFHKKAPAILTVNTIPIDKGHVQLKRCVLRRGTVAEFELVFFAEAPDISRAIGNSKLKDLDYTALAHDMLYDNVVNGDVNGNWKYGLADRGYKWSEQGEAGTQSVMDANVYSVTPNRMTPLVNAKWLFKKIVETAGFTYDGSGIDSILEGYWIPYVNSKVNQSGVDSSSYFFNAGALTDISGFTASILPGTTVTVSEVFDNGNDFATNVYTTPFTGYYTFKLWSTVDPPSGVNGHRYMRIVDSSDAVVYSTPAIAFNGNGNATNYQTTVQVFLIAGAQIRLVIGDNITQTYTVKGSATNDPNTGTGWALIATENAIAGEPLSFAANAPDKLQIDFFKGILAMHNCVAIPDRNIPNKLFIQPIVPYLSDGEVKDWTGKLDLTKDVVISPTTDEQKQVLKFTYKEGGDILSQQFTKRGRIYGDYVVSGYTAGSAADTNDFARDELAVELAFESTPSNYINGTSIPVPKFVNESGEFVVPGLRILYIAGQAQVSLYDEGIAVGVMTNVNLINNYSNVNAEVDDYDLNFAPETPLHIITGNPYSNLFNLYFREYLNEIYSPQARFMEAYFALTLADILQFKFKDKIWIKDSYWRILEIADYKVGRNDVTKVRLIKILDLSPDCDITPVSVGINGIVNFEDNAGDPAAANELCCGRYGYFWDSSTSYCYAFPPTGDPERPLGGGFGNANNFTLSLATNSSSEPDNVQSIYAGYGLRSAQGNPMSIAVGDTLEMEGAQRGSAMFGKNVYANTPGLHLGGGWNDDDRDTALGRAQGGMIMLSGADDWTASGDPIELFIEGIRAKRIDLIDETFLSCEITVSIIKVTAGVIAAQGIATFIVGLSKSGTANAATINKTYGTDNIGVFSLTVDHTTNTAQHRLAITSTGGGGHPHNNIFLSATLKYTQTRHT
jgi:hypothetical protein